MAVDTVGRGVGVGAAAVLDGVAAVAVVAASVGDWVPCGTVSVAVGVSLGVSDTLVPVGVGVQLGKGAWVDRSATSVKVGLKVGSSVAVGSGSDAS
jgi:hypothetical protein